MEVTLFFVIKAFVSFLIRTKLIKFHLEKKKEMFCDSKQLYSLLNRRDPFIV